MSVSEKIKTTTVEEEFRVCPVCRQGMGFNVSLSKIGVKRARVILICPECGARFDVGWKAAVE